MFTNIYIYIYTDIYIDINIPTLIRLLFFQRNISMRFVYLIFLCFLFFFYTLVEKNLHRDS